MDTLRALDLDAKHYQNHSEPQYKKVRTLIRALKIDDSAAVLDVGCGYGNIVSEISQLALHGKSIGADASSNMIRLAIEKHPKSKYPNLSFLQTKAEDMSFQANSFDLVLCTNCLLWFREPKKVLELMSGFLKPKGLLVVLTYVKDSQYALLFEDVLEKYFPSYKEHSAVKTMLSVEDHKNILIDNGLDVEQFFVEDQLFEYNNAQEFKNYIKGWLSCYAPLPVKLHEMFLDKIIDTSTLVNISHKDGVIAIPHQQLNIIARKPA